MKHCVLILSSFLLVTGLSSFRIAPKCSGEGSLTLSAKNNGWQVVGGKKLLAISAILKNNSVDTINFVNMSCSIIDAFTTDNDNLIFDFWGCDKNVPVTYTILPGGEYSYDLLVKCKKVLMPSSFKVCFYWVRAIPFGVFPNFKDPVNQLVWSNEITL